MSDWPDFPVILGFGSASTLNMLPPKPGKPKKRRPIGFALPPKAKP